MSAIALEIRAERTLAPRDYDRYLPLVRRLAIRLARKVPSYITVKDLVSYGWIGVLEAFEHGSSEMGEEEFEAYVMYRIRGAMFDYVRNIDPAVRDARRVSRDLASAISDLGFELGRPPKETEISARMGLPLEAYYELLDQLGRTGMARLEILDVDAFDLDPADATEEEEDEPVTRLDIARALASAIEFLPAQLQQLLGFHYTDGRSMTEIAQIYDVEEVRVLQLHTEAIHRLRAAIGRV